ncbi:MAG: hypothetical protein FWH01_14555 [Oscillospiraceae bacterium]|nr:hypothetical protein [Oscillospiraceae bacterium]
MNPSYFRIKLPMDEAINRLCNWIYKAPKEIIETSMENAVSVACVNGQWKGAALYVYYNDGWAVFEDLSGGFSSMPADDWLRFARNDPLVVAGYNDAIIYAELKVIEDNIVIKDFFEYSEKPDSYKNIGKLHSEDKAPIESWADVAAFIDEDDIVFSENGTVYIF